MTAPPRPRSARQKATDWLFAQVLARFFGVTLRLICATVRWRFEGLEHLAPFWGAGKPVIVSTWHGRLVMLPYTWMRHGRGNAYALMGLNRNGELITRIVRRFNMLGIRGGSRSGGAGARAEMAQTVANDPATTLIFTPDGPHGPPLVSKMGMAHVSRTSDLPVVWGSGACSWCLRLGTWDTMQIPLPFSRVVFRFSPPVFPGDSAELPLEAYRDALDAVGRAAHEAVDVELAAGA